VRAIAYRVSQGLRRNRLGEAITLTVVVALVGGMVLALVAGASRTLTAPDRYARWRGAVYDVSLQQSNGKPRTAEVAALPAVGTLRMATFVFGGLRRPNGDDVEEALVFAGSQEATGTLLVVGREPDPSVPGEFVASRAFVRSTGARLGDHFEGAALTQEQADQNGFDAGEPEGPTWSATLVGVFDGPSGIEDPHSAAVFPPSLLGIGDIGVSQSVGLLALRPGSTIADLRRQLDALPEGADFSLDRADWVPAGVRAAVQAQGEGLAIVAAIVALAAVVVLGQILGRQVRPTERELDGLRAVGFTDRQIVGDAVGRAAVPVVVGSLLAAVVAVGVSGSFPLGFVRRIEPHLGLRFDALAQGAGGLVLAAVLIAWVATARLVGDRKRGEAPRLRPVDRVAPRLRPASAGTGLRFALTRGARERGGVAGSLASLIVVVGLLVAALTFGLNLDRLLDQPPRFGFNFDAGLGQGGEAVPADVRAALVADHDVAAVTLYDNVTATVGAAAFSLTAMEPVTGTLVPELLSGRPLGSGDEILLGRVTAHKLGRGIGDEVTVSGDAGSVTYRVVGLAVVPSVEGGEGLGQGGVVTLAGLHRLVPDATLGTAAIRFRPGAPPGTADRLSRALGVGIGLPGPPSVIVDLVRVRSIPYVVAGVLALLVLLSLSHQLILSVTRRRRDIAVLRAVGAPRRFVAGVVHWQASTFSAAVLVVAVPLGLAAGRTVFLAFVDHLGGLDDLATPLALVAAAAAAILVLANVAASVPARRARRISPARLLSEE
jgi:hypothetical protein